VTAFALPVAREVVNLRPLTSLAATERRREKQIRSALAVGDRGTRDVYCHFRRSGKRLECAYFAGPSGEIPDNLRLLGETVRDWLGTTTPNYLWCERLREGVALVLVIGGRVVKDAIVTDGLEHELAIAITKLRAVSDRPAVFCDADDLLARVRDAAGDGATIERREARGSVMNVAVMPTLVEVRKIPAVSRWIRVWTTVRLLLTVVVLAGVAFAGYFFWIRDTGTPDVFVSSSARYLDEYDVLLKAPDAGDVITEIHAAYRRFVQDFEYWDVQWMRWTSADHDRLELSAALPLDAESDRLVSLSDREAEETAEWTDARAEASGWKITLEPRNATNPRMKFRAVATLDGVRPRDVDETAANRRPEPSRGDPWHWASIDQDFEELTQLIGTTRSRTRQTNPIYRTRPMDVELRNVEWGRPQMANWLAQRLGGGPAVLDSIVVVPEQAGSLAAVQIKFKTVWCTVDPGTGACAEAN